MSVRDNLEDRRAGVTSWVLDNDDDENWRRGRKKKRETKQRGR